MADAPSPKLPEENPFALCMASGIMGCNDLDPAAITGRVCMNCWRLGYRTMGWKQYAILIKVENGPNFVGDPTSKL